MVIHAYVEINKISILGYLSFQNVYGNGYHRHLI